MRVVIVEEYLIDLGYLFWEKNQDKMSMQESIKVLHRILDECGIEVF